ncbi:SPL family radical SAM protein [Clostridium oceanicum]|uniref:Spore photoproduct lyase n=1 Tax=Clostridium oceanicum TaxID=1543 RepID=A0ABP3UYV2_9CLOT
MKPFVPTRVYFEEIVKEYAQGKELLDKYEKMNIPIIPIKAHHRIEELRKRPNKEFTKMKKYLILGTRKTVRLTPNDKSADFIVPFTSSGCTALCLYCYLVCHFNTNSYLRIFMNRDEMIEKVKKTIKKVGEHKVYELGCNSDMVLENTITGNLKWAIEEFGKLENATATFATKFDAVDDLLDAKHNGHTQMRISINPKEIINKVEFGTSSLKERLTAANKMFEAGYKIGLNIAPIILEKDFEIIYENMFKEVSNYLLPKLKSQLFIEVIFMTYGSANFYINGESMPKAINLLDKSKMRPKGPGKYTYRNEYRRPAEKIIKGYIEKYLPDATISYIV